MRGKRGKDAPADAAVAPLLAPAEDGIGFIHDHDYGAERADRHEDPHLLALGIAHPFRAKLADLHHRQPALAGKAIDEERFAHTDAAGNEDAALDHVRLAVFEKP